MSCIFIPSLHPVMQMLQAASNIAPRGVYVCGNTTTTAGLTVTLVKEGGSGDFALEAGALVLADQGMYACRELMGNGYLKDDFSVLGTYWVWRPL